MPPKTQNLQALSLWALGALELIHFCGKKKIRKIVMKDSGKFLKNIIEIYMITIYKRKSTQYLEK